MALYPSQTVANGVFEFDQLCGETLTESLTIKDHVDTICGTCNITLADGVKLTVLDSELTFSGDGSDYFKITGGDSSFLNIQRTSIDTFGFYLVGFDFFDNMHVDGGAIKFLDNQLTTTGRIQFEAFSKLQAKDNIFNLSSTDSPMNFYAVYGDLEFKGNEIDFGYSNSLNLSSYGGNVSIKGNYATGGTAYDVWINAETGNLGFVDNVFDVADEMEAVSNGGDVMFVDNQMSFGDYLRIDSDGGDITVISNDFSPTNASDIRLYPDGGRCRVKANNPTIMCIFE
jgi:hypothetical protein